MKHFNIFLSFFLFSFGIAVGQELKIPFYESFENYPQARKWQVQQEEFGRIKPELINQNFGNSLNITVAENDQPAMKNKTDNRTRAELALLNHSIKDGDDFFYSWDLFLPENQIFNPEDSAAENYYVIMQWHEAGDGTPTYCLSGKDKRTLRTFPVSLRLLPGKPGSSKMSLHLKYGTTYGPGTCRTNSDICPDDEFSRGFREYFLKDIISPGEWHRIVMQIKWSYDGDVAFIKMWINDLPIIKAESDEGYIRCAQNPDLFMGNTNQEASILGGVPLMYTKKENGKLIVENNYLKLGHYRKGYNTTNTIFIDNFRITTEYPPKRFTTSLTDRFCNKELRANEKYELEAYEIYPVENYFFEFKNKEDSYSQISGYANFVDLMQQPWVRAGEKYEVKVKAVNHFKDGKEFDFGKSCEIKISEATHLEDIYTSESISEPYISGRNEQIFAYPLPGATDYLFQIINPAEPNKPIWVPGNGKYDYSLKLKFIPELEERIPYEIGVKAVRIENDKDVYGSLNPGAKDYVQAKKIRKNLTKRTRFNFTEDILTVQSKKRLKSIYLISKTGEVLLKSLVNEKEATLDLTPFKNKLYQIAVVDITGSVAIQNRED